MKKCEITVWDYDDAAHGRSHSGVRDFEPVKYEVEAWCVSGETGIMAFFFQDDLLYIASGDDGHWWLLYVCHKHWLHEIKKAINAISEE